MLFPVLHISKLNSLQTVSSVTFLLPLKDILLQQNIHREYANSRLTAWWVSTVEQSVQPVPRSRRHHFLYPGNSLHVPLRNFLTFKKHSIYLIEKQKKRYGEYFPQCSLNVEIWPNTIQPSQRTQETSWTKSSDQMVAALSNNHKNNKR